MQYALLGDLHSSLEDTKAVLEHIEKVAPEAEVIGLGDLFECVISKKRIHERFKQINDVILRPEGFEELLTFNSVRGNQEERIEIIVIGEDPLLDKVRKLPEMMELPEAKVIHGHQWQWAGDPWLPTIPFEKDELVFFGHSHRSAFYYEEAWHEPVIGKSYTFLGEKVGINVGSVIDNREWVLYDSANGTVVFQKVK